MQMTFQDRSAQKNCRQIGYHPQHYHAAPLKETQNELLISSLQKEQGSKKYSL